MDGDLISTILPFILIGGIALIIGGLFGALLANALQEGSARRKGSSNKARAKVVGLWRDRKTGRLVIEMDDQLHSTASKLNSTRQATLRQTLDEAIRWIGAEAPGSRISAYAKSTQPGGEIEAPPQVLPTPPQKPDGLPSPFLQPPAPITVKPPSLELRDILIRAVVPETKPLEASVGEPKSIAAQIDELLQEKLPSSTLRGRSVRVLETPGKGLVVVVDGRSYEGVGDIPDSDVRALIQSCVAEWENKI